MTGVLGASSRIAEEFMAMVPDCKGVRPCVRLDGCESYLVCSGLLNGQSLTTQPADRVAATFAVNFSDIAKWCDDVLRNEPKARICVIGSNSGYAGSYDMAYAGAKAALHLYVETKALAPEQQLVCIAPSIIDDAGMTLRRTDGERLKHRMAEHPKQRFVTSREVAALAAFLLGPMGSYITGTVVRMHGGER